MDCRNMLTPVLACLDERGHAPIINSRKSVQGLLRRLGLARSTLVEQYIGLRELIGQAGMPSAFALDTVGEDEIEKLLAAPFPPTPANTGRPLALRHDTDLEWFRAADTVPMRRLHNKITNALRTICDHAGLVLQEGAESDCLYDARILHYRGSERHLLVEVKTESSAPMCRLAFGQLHDYRRKLSDRAATDLAVLFPDRPSDDALAFFDYVGVRVMWLAANHSKLEGQVEIA